VKRLLCQDLFCARGGRQVFAALSLELPAGQAVAVTGPNGAGKSSLLRMIAGLLPPASGAIRCEGGDPDLSLGEQSHYLGHRDPFKAALSVRENLLFWQSYLGGSTGSLEAALKAVGLDTIADLPAGFLSAGQRRRLSLARLAAVKRPLWLLDEPTTALDAAGQTIFAALMQAHLREDGLIVAATHVALDIPAAELRLGVAT
jgi:heme exporter protein A